MDQARGLANVSGVSGEVATQAFATYLEESLTELAAEAPELGFFFTAVVVNPGLKQRLVGPLTVNTDDSDWMHSAQLDASTAVSGIMEGHGIDISGCGSISIAIALNVHAEGCMFVVCLLRLAPVIV